MFSGNARYTYQMKEKELKFCRQANLLTGQKLYKIQMQISGCLPSGCSLATDSRLLYIEVLSLFVNIISPE